MKQKYKVSPSHPQYQIPLPAADRVKFLGLYIDKRLMWDPHTRRSKRNHSTFKKSNPYNPKSFTSLRVPRLTFLNLPFTQISESLYQESDTFHNLTLLHPNPLTQSLSSPHLPDNLNRRLRRQRSRTLLQTTYTLIRATDEWYPKF